MIAIAREAAESPELLHEAPGIPPSAVSTKCAPPAGPTSAGTWERMLLQPSWSRAAERAAYVVTARWVFAVKLIA